MRLVVCSAIVGLVLAACTADEAPLEGRRPGSTAALTAPAAGSGVHLVRLIARGDRYAFEPAEVTLRRGELVRFVHTDFQPESVAFDSAAAPAGGAEFLARHGLVHGPLLAQPGAFHDVAFRGAPPGEYPFFSVPHRHLGMRGRIIVE